MAFMLGLLTNIVAALSSRAVSIAISYASMFIYLHIIICGEFYALFGVSPALSFSNVIFLHTPSSYPLSFPYSCIISVRLGHCTVTSRVFVASICNILTL